MFCRNCGQEVPENDKFCAACGSSTEVVTEESDGKKRKKGKKVKKQKTKIQKILSGVGWTFLAFFLIVAIFGGDSSTSFTPATFSASEKIDYKNSCQSFDYETIFRDSSQYKGQRATFRGKVVQVQYSGDKVYLRVNVTASESSFGTYTSYSDTMWATYYPSSSESRILDDDIITIYGELNGTYSYKSVMGGQITIPSIQVMVLEQGESSPSDTEGTENGTTEEILDDITSEEDVIETSQGEIQPDPQPFLPEVESNINEIDYYIDVIDSYGVALFLEYSSWDFQNEGLNNLMYGYTYDDAGCAMIDVNYDGIKELFIGIQNNGGNFMDLYTIQDEKVKLVTRNGEFGTYIFCEDELFYIQDSSGVNESQNGIYHLYDGSLVEATFVPLNEWEFKEGNIPYEPLDNYLFRP